MILSYHQGKHVRDTCFVRRAVQGRYKKSLPNYCTNVLSYLETLIIGELFTVTDINFAPQVDDELENDTWWACSS